jgi:hypothetical protein
MEEAQVRRSENRMSRTAREPHVENSTVESRVEGVGMGTLIRSLAWTVGLAVLKGVVDYALERHAEARAAERREARQHREKRSLRRD